MKFYKICYVYSINPGYTTLVLEQVLEEESKKAPVFGEFSMKLLNAKDLQLDPTLDANFIENVKAENIFFVELKNEYFNILAKGMNVEGHIIREQLL